MSQKFQELSKLLGIEVLEVRPGVISFPVEVVEFIDQLLSTVEEVSDPRVLHCIHIPVITVGTDKKLISKETFQMLKESFAAFSVDFPKYVLGKTTFRLESGRYILSNEDLQKIEDTYNKDLKNKM
jgi:hypothetical protein